MTVSGLPEPCIHHARSICHLALDMMEIAGLVQVDGESVQVCNVQHIFGSMDCVLSCFCVNGRHL